MNLEIVRLTLGPLPNNVYLLGDHDTSNAVMIDPGFDSRFALTRAVDLGWTLTQIWLTHAHFDHMAGVAEVSAAFDPPLPIGLHPADLDWYQDEGGAHRFGMTIPQPADPTLIFTDGIQLGLQVNETPVVTVHHAPGHSPGHVMFYCQALKALFCGDVIFREGIGRTDLVDGDLEILMASIRAQVLSLPDDTRLLPGHGPESTVGHERVRNPFLS